MNDFLSHPAFVEVGNARLGDRENFFMILGPCVIESEELTLEVASEVARISKSVGIPVVFKSSFDKANRTSVSSFRGPGMNSGLEILAKVRSLAGLPVISDIHSPEQASLAAEILDIIQIPAFLCRQTDILIAAGETGKPINIKKGQFMSPDDMLHPVKKILSTGNNQILLTERGASFGYNNLVADMRSIVKMKKFGFPVIFDATHSVQYPGGGEAASSGDRIMAPHLARAAVAAGADGVFMEVHPDPDRALCDGPNSLALRDVESLARNLKAIFQLVKSEDTAVEPARHFAESEKAPEPSFEDRLKNIRLIIFDVDGILTDGRIILSGGTRETKAFNVRDGHGIKLAIRSELEIAIVTGRTSEVVPQRAQELGVKLVYQKIWDKKKVLDELLQELNLDPSQVAAAGDDVVDIPLFRRVGVSFSVPEAPEEVRREASFITRHKGGYGAAREIVEMILKAQGKWDQVMTRYYE